MANLWIIVFKNLRMENKLMRIISQEGLEVDYDLPYEQVGLYRCKNEIYFLSKNLAGFNVNEDLKIAEYSSEEKAKKVMKMVRTAYLGNITFKNVGMTDKDMARIRENIENYAASFVTCYDRYNDAKIEQLNTIFVFPNDDEVE